MTDPENKRQSLINEMVIDCDKVEIPDFHSADFLPLTQRIERLEAWGLWDEIPPDEQLKTIVDLFIAVRATRHHNNQAQMYIAELIDILGDAVKEIDSLREKVKNCS